MVLPCSRSDLEDVVEEEARAVEEGVEEEGGQLGVEVLADGVEKTREGNAGDAVPRATPRAQLSRHRRRRPGGGGVAEGPDGGAAGVGTRRLIPTCPVKKYEGKSSPSSCPCRHRKGLGLPPKGAWWRRTRRSRSDSVARWAAPASPERRPTARAE